MNGELVVVDDVPGEFAERVIEAFHSRPGDSFSLALSGGDTARTCYERLAVDGAEQIDWWAVDVYWGDERCVPPEDPARTTAWRAKRSSNGWARPTRCIPCGARKVPTRTSCASANSAASTSCTSASGPTATPHRCSPARLRSTPIRVGSSC